jgi:subtilisin family serine protease
MGGARHRSLRRFLALVAPVVAVASGLTPVAGAAGGLLAPVAAGAAQPSALSPRLAVLSSPQVRPLGLAQQARRVGLTPSGAGSLLRHGRRVLVDVRFAAGAAGSTTALSATGAEVVDVSSRYQTVTVAALPGQLRALAAVSGVQAVSEEITPFTQGTGATCPQGAVVTEGDRQLEAARARNDFGVDGSGVTIGILSDSFNQWKGAPASEASDIATGDLPGPGNPCGFERQTKVVTPFIPGAYPEPGEEPENPPEPGEEGADEGRGMAQIVHDIAPGANLDFASAFNGELAFAKAIRDLQAEGAQVIADDVAYFNEPFFQDGPIADAVNEVVAKGANYFSAAGNDNLMNAEGEDIGSFEAPAYRSIECPEALPAYYESCMNFAAGGGEEDNTFGVTVEEGWPLFLDLQWAQPWNGVTTDFDMFLVREEGKELVEGGEAFNTPNTEPGRQEPYEFIPWEAHEEEGEKEVVEVVIARCNLTCGEGRAKKEVAGVKPYEGTKGGDDGTPRLKLAIVNNGGGVPETEYPPAAVEGTEDVVGPTIFGHTAAKSAISAAAINVGTKEEPEEYSSRGPVLHLFGPVSGTAPAPSLGEETIAKPNVTASDCGSTTFFFGFREGGFHFCGTSAAAPHAAGVAALIRSANPGASNAQVRADLESTTIPVGSSLFQFGPDAVGAGLVDAENAVAALALPPTVTIVTPPAAVSGVRQPSIAFGANRRASFTCSLDGVSTGACASPYVPAKPLGEGSHTFKVTATDVAGRIGSAAASFKIDLKGPTAKFDKHPPKVIRTKHKQAKLTFRFGSSEKNSTYLCKVDKGKFHGCPVKLTKSFKVGKHSVAVKAVDAYGNVGKPATFSFRVEQGEPKARHHRNKHRS